MAFGALDTATLVTTSNPLPVDIRAENASVTVDNAGTFAVQATIAAGATAIAKAEDDASANLDVGVPSMAVRKATPANTSGADGDYEMLQMSAGRLWVDGSGVTLTVGSHAVTNAGTFVVQENGAALTALQLLDDTVATDGSATPTVAIAVAGQDGTNAQILKTDSVGQLQVGVLALPSIPAGTNAIGKLSANSGVDIGDVDVTSISAGTNLIGDVGIQGRTTGGASFHKTIDLDESEEEIKATAATFKGGIVLNLTNALLYLKLYNATAANVTVGTTTPDITIPIPGNNDTDGAGFTLPLPPEGLAFGTALTAAVTTGIADNDTGAPAANACAACFFYK